MDGAVAEKRLYYRAKEVASLLGLGLRTVYEGVYAGWIPSRKIGNSRLIPAAWLTAASQEDAAFIAEQFRASIVEKTDILSTMARACTHRPLRLVQRFLTRVAIRATCVLASNVML